MDENTSLSAVSMNWIRVFTSINRKQQNVTTFWRLKENDLRPTWLKVYIPRIVMFGYELNKSLRFWETKA